MSEKICIYDLGRKVPALSEKIRNIRLGVKIAKKVKIFSAVLQISSYIASRGACEVKINKIFPSVFQFFAYVASRRQ